MHYRRVGLWQITLINHTLYPIAATKLNHASTLTPGPFEAITGLEFLDKVVDIDQSPIGRTPRSNPATYTEFSLLSANCSPELRKHEHAATNQADLVLM